MKDITLPKLRIIQDFLTIRKNEYNFHLARNVERVFRLYDKKTSFLPPTINYIFEKKNTELQPMNKTLWLEIKELPEEIKERFKDNIIIQEEVLRIIKKRNEKFNYRCWLIKLTTWKGKSHIILDVASYYQTNTLVLVHNVKTLWEMCQKFEDFTNIKPAQYGWGKKELWKITIMTKKSFVLDYEKFTEEFWLVLIDEAPIWFSKLLWNWLNAFFDWKSWIALYWLSWTPEKNELNVNDLEKYFWKIIEVSWQKNNWYNIIPDFTMYDYKYSWFYEYENPAEMRTAVSENMDRLKLQIKEIKELFQLRKCLLILTDRKIEVENLYNNKDFWFTFVMTWDTKIKDDNENIEIARKLIEAWKRVCIIGTIQKIGVGVDIPFIDTVFLASAIKFRSTVIQAIWRWLRKHKWKTNVSVWVWNDLPHYKWQRSEKLKTIKSEYWIWLEDIDIIKI